MSAAKLPTGWSVEMLGLAAAVKFTAPSGMVILWCDGRWTMGSGTAHMPARGIPYAATMKEARTIGTAWIATTIGEGDDD